jgi:hypothetical protein
MTTVSLLPIRESSSVTTVLKPDVQKSKDNLDTKADSSTTPVQVLDNEIKELRKEKEKLAKMFVQHENNRLFLLKVENYLNNEMLAASKHLLKSLAKGALRVQQQGII